MKMRLPPEFKKDMTMPVTWLQKQQNGCIGVHGVIGVRDEIWKYDL